MKRGDYVIIGNGRKVYEVVAVSWVNEVRVHKLAATADHPDAARSAKDLITWYPANELTEVGRR